MNEDATRKLHKTSLPTSPSGTQEDPIREGNVKPSISRPREDLCQSAGEGFSFWKAHRYVAGHRAGRCRSQQGLRSCSARVALGTSPGLPRIQWEEEAGGTGSTGHRGPRGGRRGVPHSSGRHRSSAPAALLTVSAGRR